ncbi:MAG: hypothetical protein U0R19_21840 [Bryobacteraceae bacterium]
MMALAAAKSYLEGRPVKLPAKSRGRTSGETLLLSATLTDVQFLVPVAMLLFGVTLLVLLA